MTYNAWSQARLLVHGAFFLLLRLLPFLGVLLGSLLKKGREEVASDSKKERKKERKKETT